MTNNYSEYTTEDIIDYTNDGDRIWGRTHFRVFTIKQLLDALTEQNKYHDEIKNDILDRLFKSKVGDVLHLGHYHLQSSRSVWLHYFNGNADELAEDYPDETPTGIVRVGGEVWAHYGNYGIDLGSTYERVK